jgi:hypothetical protein
MDRNIRLGRQSAANCRQAKAYVLSEETELQAGEYSEEQQPWKSSGGLVTGLQNAMSAESQ